jgi:hypothetical protein
LARRLARRSRVDGLCLKFEHDIRPLFRDKDRTSMLNVSGR